jgi:CheY-like chemotaxis protein
VRQIVSDLRTFGPSPGDDDSRLVSVERILDSMINIASNEIRHRATLVREYQGVRPVLASEARLGQVFLNLLVNAAQAIPEGAAQENRIRVRTRHRGSEVLVEVADTGVGIPAENLARIFDPFFTTKARELGTGLGLSICHQMLHRYRGHIEVESELGVGSLFRVALPAAPLVTADADAAPQVTIYPPRPAARFLVIDDDPAVGRALSRMLRPHDVYVARDGFDALEALSRGSDYQGILCDVMMPAMSGEEFYERLGERWPELVPRFVFVTGGAFTERAQSFLNEVSAPTLQKPIDPQELQRLLARLLSE